MDPRQTGRPAELGVLAVDEDQQHANHMRSMLPHFNYNVRVYTSPVSALNFLKDHAQDVDFLLVAVRMEEMSGYQFLNIATNMNRNVQVLMMSTETTLEILKTSVDLGASFLVKKPLDDSTMRTMWQHVELPFAKKIERIKLFLGGPAGEQSASESGVIDPSGEESGAETGDMNRSSLNMKASTANNVAAQSLVDYPNSEDGETVENGCEGDKDNEAGAPPGN